MKYSIRIKIISPVASKGEKKNVWTHRNLKTEYAETQEKADEKAMEILRAMSPPYRGEIVIVTGPISWKGERQENRMVKGEKVSL